MASSDRNANSRTLRSRGVKAAKLCALASVGGREQRRTCNRDSESHQRCVVVSRTAESRSAICQSVRAPLARSSMLVSASCRREAVSKCQGREAETSTLHCKHARRAAGFRLFLMLLPQVLPRSDHDPREERQATKPNWRGQRLFASRTAESKDVAGRPRNARRTGEFPQSARTWDSNINECVFRANQIPSFVK
jgi:hypothetical protein